MDWNKFPKSLQIMGAKIKIKYVDSLDKKGSDADTYGECVPFKRVIYIAKGKHETEQEVYHTILHEAIHCILALSGTGHSLEHDQEESIVLALETGLTTLLPQLFTGIKNV
jgi:hypothetical protein